MIGFLVIIGLALIGLRVATIALAVVLQNAVTIGGLCLAAAFLMSVGYQQAKDEQKKPEKASESEKTLISYWR